jgi:hypothetical protein
MRRSKRSNASKVPKWLHLPVQTYNCDVTAKCHIGKWIWNNSNLPSFIRVSRKARREKRAEPLWVRLAQGS